MAAPETGSLSARDLHHALIDSGIARSQIQHEIKQPTNEAADDNRCKSANEVLHQQAQRNPIVSWPTPGGRIKRVNLFGWIVLGQQAKRLPHLLAQ